MRFDIAITTTSMGNGHIMKAIAIKRAFERINAELGLDADVTIIDEKLIVSPATIQIKRMVELAYNLISSNRYLKRWWDRKVMEPDGQSIEKAEALIGFVNRCTGGKCVRSGNKDYDAIISTHPSDRIAIFPKDTVFLRVNPDVFGHAFHFIPHKGMDEWHIVVDEELKKSILQGKEKSLPEEYIPNISRLVVAGAFVHPENLDAIADGSYD